MFHQQLLGRSLCALLVTLLLPFAFFSQNLTRQRDKKGVLRIVVTCQGNTKPVDGADVIVWSGDGEFEDGTKTDPQGLAKFASVPHGNLKIQILKLGWKTWGGQLEFKDDSPIKISLEQDQKPKPAESPKPSGSPTPS